MLRTHTSGICWVLIFAAAVASDQATKLWALSNLSEYRGKDVFFSLALSFNRGISFSMLDHYDSLSFLLSVSGLVLLGIVCLLSRRAQVFFRPPGTAFLWAGAFANFIDRVSLGHVVDWINILGLRINLADLWLCVGCLFLFSEFHAAERQRSPK